MSRILLLESDHVLAGTLASLLASAGHETVIIADAQAAVVAADGIQPEIIITDLLLAGRSGAEFLYEFRSYPDWQKIPVIIYSSLPPSDVPLDGSCFAHMDVAHYFYKPTTSLSQLLDSVNALLPVTI